MPLGVAESNRSVAGVRSMLLGVAEANQSDAEVWPILLGVADVYNGLCSKTGVCPTVLGVWLTVHLTLLGAWPILLGV